MSESNTKTFKSEDQETNQKDLEGPTTPKVGSTIGENKLDEFKEDELEEEKFEADRFETRRELLQSQVEAQSATHLKQPKLGSSTSVSPQLKSKKPKKKQLYKSKMGHSENFLSHTKKKLTMIRQFTLQGRSLYLMDPKNSFRVFCAKIVYHKHFDDFILLLIIVSTGLLALENPLKDPNSALINALGICDSVFTAFFLLECVLKVITHGFLLNGRKSYLRNAWNMVDFLIVVFAVVTFG